MKTIEFITAFGDAINRIYNTDHYTGLERLTEPIQLVVASPNPGVKEFFQWHRKKEFLNIKEVPFYGQWNRQRQEEHGINESEVVLDTPRSGEVIFYPSPEDLKILKVLKEGPPYIVFSLSASTDNRNIPESIGKDASQRCYDKGFQVLRVGRNYKQQLHESFRPNEDVTHSEPQITGNWVIDAVDKLSVPGTMLAVQGAAGIFCAHSAISLASFHMRKPTFILLPEKYYNYMNTCDDQFTFGKKQPEVIYGEHKDYTRGFMNMFLDKFVEKCRGCQTN